MMNANDDILASTFVNQTSDSTVFQIETAENDSFIVKKPVYLTFVRNVAGIALP